MNEFLKYAIAGMLGISFHVFAVKIPSLKLKGRVANHPFIFREYLSDDWPAMLASFVSVSIFIIALDEILGLRPELAKYITIMFVFVGFTGSSIIQSLLSVANKKIMQVIDVKTNIADEIVPPVTSSNLAGAKEIIKEETGPVQEKLSQQ